MSATNDEETRELTEGELLLQLQRAAQVASSFFLAFRRVFFNQKVDTVFRAPGILYLYCGGDDSEICYAPSPIDMLTAEETNAMFAWSFSEHIIFLWYWLHDWRTKSESEET